MSKCNQTPLWSCETMLWDHFSHIMVSKCNQTPLLCCETTLWDTFLMERCPKCNQTPIFCCETMLWNHIGQLVAGPLCGTTLWDHIVRPRQTTLSTNFDWIDHHGHLLQFHASLSWWNKVECTRWKSRTNWIIISLIGQLPRFRVLLWWWNKVECTAREESWVILALLFIRSHLAPETDKWVVRVFWHVDFAQIASRWHKKKVVLKFKSAVDPSLLTCSICETTFLVKWCLVALRHHMWDHFSHEVLFGRTSTPCETTFLTELCWSHLWTAHKNYRKFVAKCSKIAKRNFLLGVPADRTHKSEALRNNRNKPILILSLTVFYSSVHSLFSMLKSLTVNRSKSIKNIICVKYCSNCECLTWKNPTWDM